MRVTIEFEIGEETCSARIGHVCRWFVEFPGGKGVFCSFFDLELVEEKGKAARCSECLKRWPPGTKPAPIPKMTPKEWRDSYSIGPRKKARCK